MTTRRTFCSSVAAFAAAGCAGVPALDADVTWTRGHFQIHQIYTGVCESFLLVFPDGTSMLLDCGDSDPHRFQADRFGDRSLPILPSESRRAGEWIARYVKRMNPHGDRVDYLYLSHFHGDHSGSIGCSAGVRTDLLPDGERYNS